MVEAHSMPPQALPCAATSDHMQVRSNARLARQIIQLLAIDARGQFERRSGLMRERLGNSRIESMLMYRSNRVASIHGRSVTERSVPFDPRFRKSIAYFPRTARRTVMVLL